MSLDQQGDVLTGGCLCGAVRYRIISAPRKVVNCHCSLCRRAGAAPYVPWACVPVADFAYTAGQPAVYAATERAQREFCSHCGTQLTFQYHARPDQIDVTVCSLDDPNALAPQVHIWVDSKLAWVEPDPHLPQRAQDP